MKRFDGTHDIAYTTLFGIIAIETYKSSYVLKLVTKTLIDFPYSINTLNIIGYRIFTTVEEAEQFIQTMEANAIDDIELLLQDCVGE